MSKYPDFYIVGAAKAGTTSLYHYLEKIPEIFMSKIKEPNFFSQKQIFEQGLYYNTQIIKSENEYLALFEKSSQSQLKGEVSVSYLFYPGVAENIFKSNPDSKIIIMLRNPVNRAFSHYHMDKRLGYVTEQFDTIIRNQNNYPLHYQQYVSLGYYYQQVKRYIEVFGENKVKIIIFELFIKNVKREVKEVCSFLGLENTSQEVFIDKAFNENINTDNSIVQRLYRTEWLRKIFSKFLREEEKDRIKSKLFNKGNKLPMNNKTRAFLHDLYNEDVNKLRELINKELECWN